MDRIYSSYTCLYKNTNQIYIEATSSQLKNDVLYTYGCNNIVVTFQASLLQGDETEGLHTRNAHRINCTARAIAVKVSYKINSTDSSMKPHGM